MEPENGESIVSFEATGNARKTEDFNNMTMSMKRLSVRKTVKKIGKKDAKACTRKGIRNEKKTICQSIKKILDVEKSEDSDPDFSSLRLLLDTFTDEKHRSPFASKDDTCRPSSMALIASVIGHKPSILSVVPPAARPRRRSC